MYWIQGREIGKWLLKELRLLSLLLAHLLHGIILAESYGVPALFLNDIKHDLFK